MAALTANRVRHVRGVHKPELVTITGIDSEEFYEGAMANYAAAASKVNAAADTASQRFAGVVATRLTTAASNTLKVEMERGHQEWFAHDGNLGAGDEGKNAIILDDQTLTNAATATNDVPAGEIVEFETINGTAGCWIKVGVFAPTNA